jgi:hypothetical protein
MTRSSRDPDRDAGQGVGVQQGNLVRRSHGPAAERLISDMRRSSRRVGNHLRARASECRSLRSSMKPSRASCCSVIWPPVVSPPLLAAARCRTPLARLSQFQQLWMLGSRCHLRFQRCWNAFQSPLGALVLRWQPSPNGVGLAFVTRHRPSCVEFFGRGALCLRLRQTCDTTWAGLDLLTVCKASPFGEVTL